jgi:hypothetical protein
MIIIIIIESTQQGQASSISVMRSCYDLDLPGSIAITQASLSTINWLASLSTWAFNDQPV